MARVCEVAQSDVLSHMLSRIETMALCAGSRPTSLVVGRILSHQSESMFDLHGNDRHHNHDKWRKVILTADCRLAFTRIQLVVVLVVIALSVTILAVLSSGFAWQRELSRRRLCESNLKKMGAGFYTATPGGDWPIAAPNSMDNPNPTAVQYFNMTGKHGGPGAIGDPAAQAPGQYWADLSTTRCMWHLIRMGGISPESFICPSSDDRPDTVGDPTLFWDFPSRPGDTTADRGWKVNTDNEKCVSYGYQVPYGRRGRPHTEADQRMPLAADKGPYGGISLGSKSTATPPTSLDVNSDSKQWRPFNSLNHSGKGQCVLFADSHVEFMATPIVGVDHDNIYTAWRRQGDQGDGTTRLHGDRPDKVAPYDALTPAADTDSLIYP